MTPTDWQLLERLCRRALDEHPEVAAHPSIGGAVRLTGAFAAATADAEARGGEHRA